MKMRKLSRLWRVDWVHRNGYQAPSRYVEAKTRKEAHAEAKESSRLADFPESWRHELTKLWKEDE